MAKQSQDRHRMMAWVRLLRLSNAPTALADVVMGLAVATGGALPSAVVCVAIAIASLLIYHAGMVLNDAVDASQDALERPERPIPSGQVSRTQAFQVAGVMLVLGLGCASLAAWLLASWAPAAITMLLVCFVLAYDSPLKKTMFGPALMGLCRGLNVLLGMSPALTLGAGLAIAPGVVLYVTGLTWVASQEATQTRRLPIAWGAFVSLAGLAWLALAPWRLDTGLWPRASPTGWWLLWGVITLMITRHYAAALLWPQPQVVRRAVVGALQGIVVIDAALAAGYAGPFWGVTVLLMLPLTMFAARFAPQT